MKLAIFALIAVLSVFSVSFAQDTDTACTEESIGDEACNPLNKELLDAIETDLAPKSGVIDGVINSDEEAVHAVIAVVEAARNGLWVLFASGALSLIVWTFARFELADQLSGSTLVVTSLLLGVGGGTAVGLATMSAFTLEGLVMILIESFVAAGGVTVIGNSFRQDRKD